MNVLKALILLFIVFSRVNAEGVTASQLPASERFYSDQLDLQLEIRAVEHFMALNQLQHWNVSLMRLDGTPVVIESLTFDGGMPAHRHGLPTTPQTSVSGSGAEIKGIRFSMPGVWRLAIGIETKDTGVMLQFETELRYGQAPSVISAEFREL